jgi:hypothetical protein
MPIKPENRHHYQTEAYLVARQSALKRAAGKCEFCFVGNGQRIFREPSGEPWSNSQVETHRRALGNPAWMSRSIRIVLTCAHLNQDPEDNRLINLRALCQRCHNLIDLPYRTLNAAATRAAKKATS